MPTTSRSGWSFNGWYTAKTGGTKITTTTTMPLGGTTYYAQWTDATNPNLATSYTPDSWTNQNVTINITASDNQSGLKSVTVNGTTITITNGKGSYSVSTNGSYTVVATDNSGRTTTKVVQITNIDKVKPTINEVNPGTMLYKDPTFKSGTNSTKVYNNKNNGTVTVTRKAMSDSPTGSGYGLEIKTTGEAQPNHGGFCFKTPISVNKVNIIKIIAKIPVGRSLGWVSNQTGDNSTFEWKTSQAGTGDWETYIGVLKCGSSGFFYNTNYFALFGGNTATASSPIVWQVAYATVFDTTKWTNGQELYMDTKDDASGIAAYGINQSSTTQPQFKTVTNTKSYINVSDINSIKNNGTYYLWIKDAAGNVSNKSFTVSYVDNVAPTLNLSHSGTTITITNDVPNIYKDYTPYTATRDSNGNGVTSQGKVQKVSSSGYPIESAATWLFTKTGVNHQWHGFDGTHNGIFDLNKGDKLAITGYYYSSSNNTVKETNLGFYGLKKPDWSSFKTTTLLEEKRISSSNTWQPFFNIIRAEENITDALLNGAPTWEYAEGTGQMWINGLNWRIIPASNTTAEDILIRKYAKGEQTVAYFQNGGGTPFNDNKFSVSDSGTYTVYVEDKAGNGTVKVIDAKINTYTIKFNGNGSTSGSTASMSMTVGVSKNLTANGFKRTGYTFTGWNTKADGSGTSYANKASVNNLTTTKGATVTLYAQWRKMY